MRYAPHIVVSQGAVVESFVKGLIDRLYTIVCTGKPMNYLEVVELAKRVEESLRRSGNQAPAHHHQSGRKFFSPYGSTSHRPRGKKFKKSGLIPPVL